MAASAEYELEKRVERLELFPVELEKGERPGARPCGSPLVPASALDLQGLRCLSGSLSVPHRLQAS